MDFKVLLTAQDFLAATIVLFVLGYGANMAQAGAGNKYFTAGVVFVVMDFALSMFALLLKSFPMG